MADIQGGCLCGKVRFTASAEPSFVGIRIAANADLPRQCAVLGGDGRRYAEFSENAGMRYWTRGGWAASQP